MRKKNLSGEMTEVSTRVISHGAILCTTPKPTSQSEPRKSIRKEETRCGSSDGHNKEKQKLTFMASGKCNEEIHRVQLKCLQ